MSLSFQMLTPSDPGQKYNSFLYAPCWTSSLIPETNPLGWQSSPGPQWFPLLHSGCCGQLLQTPSAVHRVQCTLSLTVRLLSPVRCQPWLCSAFLTSAPHPAPPLLSSGEKNLPRAATVYNPVFVGSSPAPTQSPHSPRPSHPKQPQAALVLQVSQRNRALWSQRPITTPITSAHFH